MCNLQGRVSSILTNWLQSVSVFWIPQNFLIWRFWPQNSTLKVLFNLQLSSLIIVVGSHRQSCYCRWLLPMPECSLLSYVLYKQICVKTVNTIWRQVVHWDHCLQIRKRAWKFTDWSVTNRWWSIVFYGNFWVKTIKSNDTSSFAAIDLWTARDIPQLCNHKAFVSGLGHCVAELELPKYNVPIIKKMKFSMCVPQLVEHLGPAKAVILCGIEAHVCVLHTTFDMLERGIDVHVVADAVSSRSQTNRSRDFLRLKL